MPKLEWELKDKESCEGCPELGREYFWYHNFTCFLGYKLKRSDMDRLTPDYVEACEPTDLRVGKIRPMACRKKLGD